MIVRPAIISALAGAVITTAACTAAARTGPPPPAAQNPSPMVEESRTHERLTPVALRGTHHRLAGILPRPVELFIPAGATASSAPLLLVHFLGPAFIANAAAARADSSLLAATVNLTAGSGAYEQPFHEIITWHRLIGAIDSVVRAQTGRSIRPGSIYLSAFSAGNGAVRAILADSTTAAGIAGVLILDGIHTGYQPPRRVVAEGGTLDPKSLESLLRYARRAMRGETRMIITHSEIFPGTFASTTETANWLLGQLGVKRERVLAWGPLGMQQISGATRGRFKVLSFAGNSAPDHIDHLHALPTFIRDLVR